MKLTEYDVFILEQKNYFLEHLAPTFKEDWDSEVWIGGTKGSGWIQTRSGNSRFNFCEITKMKGLDPLNIDSTFQEFIKATLVLSYRKSNSKASPQKLYAEFLILKRWYYSLIQEFDEHSLHPCKLSTEILLNSFQILKENSQPNNLPDHAGTYQRLQELLNHYAFTNCPLGFSEKYLYLNRQNRTPNARKTKALIEQFELDDSQLDIEKLISIRTFLNIISLISLCKSDGEKLILNLLLLLIITGLRSTEAFLLRKRALIRKPIVDPVSKQQIEIDGIKQFTLGIKYHGAKGAGYRTHWVEPSATTLVESIFTTVIELTKSARTHIVYLRKKQLLNFLPETVDLIDVVLGF